MPHSFGKASTLVDKRPLLPNEEAEFEIRESDKAGRRPEEDLEDNMFSETLDDHERNKGQQTSSSVAVATKKAKAHRAKPYEIRTDEVENE